MKGETGDLLRLRHILKCTEEIEAILAGVTESDFYNSLEKKYAVERLLEIIGEAVNRIEPSTLALSKRNIPWNDIVDFRNFVSHEYFRIDYTIVYQIATTEIYPVKQAVQEIVEHFGNK